MTNEKPTPGFPAPNEEDCAYCCDTMLQAFERKVLKTQGRGWVKNKRPPLAATGLAPLESQNSPALNPNFE